MLRFIWPQTHFKKADFCLCFSLVLFPSPLCNVHEVKHISPPAAVRGRHYRTETPDTGWCCCSQADKQDWGKIHFLITNVKDWSLNRSSHWTMSYEQNEISFLFWWNRLLCFPVSHWLKHDDSVLDSAYDWLALGPLHRSDHSAVNNTATRLWERQNERERSETWNQVSHIVRWRLAPAGLCYLATLF